ncbi:MAG: Mut7-C ubiquitin/RNAse domain-containing protein [Candidatus Pacebacteria bacterium]|nr:Mut7-C ubiquitin/RNAse domain-containing protein [Candidatus Paceibacterota bacterium]
MSVILRFYEELNDFLPRHRRRKSFSVPYTEPRSVKDLIESLGIPHTEIDLILVNDASVGFDYLVKDKDRVAVYPMFESMDITAVSKLDRPPLRHPEFVADVHLGKLVRRLRLLGFDCLYNKEWRDRELALISAQSQRILLTRDVGLLKRQIVTHGMYLHSDDPSKQLREVVHRLHLKNRIQPLARCLLCNGPMRKVPKEKVRGRVPEKTYAYTDEFLECENCKKIYWKGTHWKRLQEIIRNALS